MSDSAVVDGLNVDSLLPSGTAAQLSWNALVGADAYQIEGGPVGGATRARVLTTNSTNVPGLSPGTSYSWRVRARCAGTGDITAFSASNTFTTPTLRLAADAGQLELWPNPASGSVQVQLPAVYQQDNALLRVYNSTGQVVLQQQASASGVQSLDLSGLTPGIYHVEARSASNVHHSSLNVH